jgi:diazepam-binding inhibitor (GABA receptor modulating acyl-CoA-binding protein)
LLCSCGQEDFLAAVEKVNKFSKKPKDDELLIVYGLYKQATVGDVNTRELSLPLAYDVSLKVAVSRSRCAEAKEYT